MAVFLSNEWFVKVGEMTAAKGDLEVPSNLAALVLNVTVTGAAAGNVDMCLNGGRFESGHNSNGATKLTLPADSGASHFCRAGPSLPACRAS
jgi:hypothetical protein